ncbi:MAG: CoA transferase [Dehalococcoidales bacterium]|nr:CoA transferase [Dehalococcoidales bacterium]
MAGLLDGIKVVSMEHMEAMPAASVWLADWGADVIKVEPVQGEKWRGGGRGMPTSQNWSFQLLNRNKRSLALNLKTDEGMEILYKMVKDADVFMSNYQLGALKGLKADYETLKKINPGLVYAFLSGYGTEGPDKDERGYDFTAAWARAGFQYIIGEPGDPPAKEPGGIMDRTTAPHAVAGICAALLHREKTGEGQYLEIAIYRSAVWTLALDIEGCLSGRTVERTSRTNPMIPMINAYRAADDRWFQLAMLPADFTWPDVYKSIGRPELETDARFATDEARMENTEELVKILDEEFAKKTFDEWNTIFKKYDFIFAPIKSPAEVITDPQAIANNFFGEIEHPDGNITVVNSPVKFVQNPASLRSPAPEVGEHNDTLLAGLGYSSEDIAGLRERGIIP